MLNIYGNSFVIIHRSSSILIELIKKNIDIHEKLLPLDLDYDLFLISKEVVFDFINNELVLKISFLYVKIIFLEKNYKGPIIYSKFT